MKRVRVTESDLQRIVKKVIKEEEESLLKKVLRKLKGVSDKQLEYNMENGLPWDWKGTKEGFYNKMEPRKDNRGSN